MTGAYRNIGTHAHDAYIYTSYYTIKSALWYLIEASLKVKKFDMFSSLWTSPAVFTCNTVYSLHSTSVPWNKIRYILCTHDSPLRREFPALFLKQYAVFRLVLRFVAGIPQEIPPGIPASYEISRDQNAVLAFLVHPLVVLTQGDNGSNSGRQRQKSA